MVLVLCLNRSLPVGFELVTLSKFNSHFFFLFSFVLLRRKSRGRSKVRQHAQNVSIPRYAFYKAETYCRFLHATLQRHQILFSSESRAVEFIVLEYGKKEWRILCVWNTQCAGQSGGYFASLADCKKSKEVKFSLCTLSGLQLNFVHRTAFPRKSYCLCDQFL